MQDTGVLGAMFDLSFSEFVTTRVIRILYILGMVVAGLLTLTLIGSAFSSGFMVGLVALILSPVLFLIYTLLARIWCEMIIVVFRIAENTGRLAQASQVKPPVPAGDIPAA